MDKSSKDIDAQLKRVLALAESIGGKYLENAKHRVDVQYFAHIARRAKTQHGIKIFGDDPNERKPFIYQQEPEKVQEAVIEIVKEQPEPEKTPTEEAHERMKFNDWMSADEKNRYQTQMTCRHKFIKKMYAELLCDMEICKMEGWDILEYPRMMRDAIQVCFPKKPVQLKLAL